ncbi:MAG: SMC-Scp complex subunit ScpB [Rhodospirillaceae bacterium]|jgi:segregation and condensation protein B|nr:SMC-Scp complex subunit ScpB [Rhodospirillaceae bacterium]MBT4046303.1 SMC-Scp complex subunit ScpB [Rhodospirillaceae bacterium]MBT4689249.1 SMC-Scp complex subunit ScpB [Rhodospirillaceae bacterium]MBT5082326.1 SMC-Scp complex subunit ScpB [Rhodospirillaceae bacterium]MBT5523440.1 SMC-Scp complex subunit ScpB [Rhodospirillaceae bacterium]
MTAQNVSEENVPEDSAPDDSAPIDNGTEPVVDEYEANHLRMIEALLFAATEPLDERSMSARLPEGADVPELLRQLSGHYANRGVNLVQVAGKWAMRTAPDLHFLLQEHRQQTRKLSRAGLETLAITAYHQPVTRAEIEDVRGVSLSKGTLDLLMELGWVRIRGRRRTPGRPVTYGTTDGFLEHFGFQSAKDLPGLDELKASGLLEGQARTDLLPLSHREPEDPLAEGDDGSEATLADFEDDGQEAEPAPTAEIIDLPS